MFHQSKPLNYGLNLDPQRPRRQQNQMAKSTSVGQLLKCGGVSNSQYFDSLQRFRKDYATADKEERDNQRQKKLRILEERKNQQVQREYRNKKNQYQYDQRNLEKINQSRYLCETGLKKNGLTHGIPMNPITLKYFQTPFGNQQQYCDEQSKIRKVVRTHNLQNASTCGYNLVNGQNLPSLNKLVPKDAQGRFQTKLGQFYNTKKLDPMVDLQLNPKNLLPKYIGECDRSDISPIKYHQWQQDENVYRTAYQYQFTEKPLQSLANSIFQQSMNNHLLLTKQSPVIRPVPQNDRKIMQQIQNMQASNIINHYDSRR